MNSCQTEVSRLQKQNGQKDESERSKAALRSAKYNASWLG